MYRATQLALTAVGQIPRELVSRIDANTAKRATG